MTQPVRRPVVPLPARQRHLLHHRRRYDTFNAMANLGIDRGWRRELVRATHISRARACSTWREHRRRSVRCANLGHPSESSPPTASPRSSPSPSRRLSTIRQRCRSSLLYRRRAGPAFRRDFDVGTVALGCATRRSKKNFAEVLRVLKPGGRYIVLEFSSPNRPLARCRHDAYLRHAIPAIGGALTGDRDGSSISTLDPAVPAQAELAAELRRTGFTTIS